MRYRLHQFDDTSVSIVEVRTNVNPDGTIDDRVFCDFPLYGDPSLDEGAYLDAEKVLALLNGVEMRA